MKRSWIFWSRYKQPTRPNDCSVGRATNNFKEMLNKKIKMNSRNIFVLISLCTFVLVLVFGFSSQFASEQAKAAGGGGGGGGGGVALPFFGYAWSGNAVDNVGWISFNCANLNTCSTVNYGVTVNSSTKDLTGKAWSPRIGWIQFGGLSGFPAVSSSGPGSVTLNANAKIVGNNIVGWARALSGTIDPNDGWDGWISLGGLALTGGGFQVSKLIGKQAHAQGGAPYGVQRTGNDFSGFAWGSEVLGWIEFDISLDIPPPSITLTVDGFPFTTKFVGEDAQLVWSAAPIEPGSCSATSSANDWIGSKNDSGSDTIGPFPVIGTFTYTLTCEGLDGTFPSVDVVVGVFAPTLCANNPINGVDLTLQQAFNQGLVITQDEYCLPPTDMCANNPINGVDLTLQQAFNQGLDIDQFGNCDGITPPGEGELDGVPVFEEF